MDVFVILERNIETGTVQTMGAWESLQKAQERAYEFNNDGNPQKYRIYYISKVAVWDHE